MTSLLYLRASLWKILHQEINILLDSPDSSFQCRVVDSRKPRLRSRVVFWMQNFMHDLLAVRKICPGKTVHIGITDFELPGQNFLLHTGYHLIHDLNASHELFRTGNIGFADIVPLCNLLADACICGSGRNCVNLTQFLRGGFLGSSRVLVVLLIELGLFGCQLRMLGFQLVRTWQLGDVVYLKIGHCRPVRCQLCTMLFFKGCWSFCSF